jgi:hypothetical protein
MNAIGPSTTSLLAPLELYVRPAFISRFPGYTFANCERSVMAAKKTASAKTAKKTSAKKEKKTARRYGPKASANVKTAMEELKAGTLRSGGSGKKVTDPKQAIAIGLSEARRNGAKVPERPE